MDVRLTMVHFQLTLNCNLRCAFCGQSHTAERSPVDWFSLLEELADYAPGCRIVLWGGEPLLYPGFDALARRAREMGFVPELITNGTLMDRHLPVLRECFDCIRVSVDGPEKIHDAIRGQGVFAAVRRNLELLRGSSARLGIMSVLTPETMPFAVQVPFGLPVQEAILHEMIAFPETDRSIPGTEDWPLLTETYRRQLQATVEDLQKHSFPVPVVFQPHFPGGQPCREPYRHLHVHADGETGFCTDFVHESLGSVLQQSIGSIFEGPRAQAFRERGENAFCAHCPWKNTPETVVTLPCTSAGRCKGNGTAR